MISYKKKSDVGELAGLLEHYFAGLSDVCHTLFGKHGEEALYGAIGEKFVQRLESQTGFALRASQPWEAYCELVKMFTDVGFYSSVELKDLGDGRYWMLEAGQYAGAVWEEQGSWERGTPPCPLWASIVYTLGRMGYTIVLDDLKFDDTIDGYESTFHFEPCEVVAVDLMGNARKVIASEILPICAHCKKVRDSEGNWKPIESYLLTQRSVRCSHGICDECMAEHYPGI